MSLGAAASAETGVPFDGCPDSRDESFVDLTDVNANADDAGDNSAGIVRLIADVPAQHCTPDADHTSRLHLKFGATLCFLRAVLQFPPLIFFQPAKTTFLPCVVITLVSCSRG